MGAAAERWTALVGNRTRGEGPRPGGRGMGPGPGPGMAERLREDASRDMTRAPLYQAVLAALGPERTVLDIGAGPGRYSLPLARAGCRVWAVEPGDPMREILEADRARLAPEAAARLTVVAGAWPESRDAVPPVEVAFASLVIHFCPDAPAFLRAMSAAASRRCLLAIRERQMNPLVETLWPRFHPERPFPRQPVLADLRAVLEEVGISAEVQVHEAMRRYGHFASREEARSQLAGMLGVEGPDDLTRLDEALDGLLTPGADGGVAAGEPVREGLLEWTPVLSWA